MMCFALGFLVGIVSVQCAPALYPLSAYGASLLITGAVWWRVPPWRPGVCLVLAMIVGAGYASWRAQSRLDVRLPVSLDGADVRWSGTVVGLPQRMPEGIRFVFEPDMPTTGGVAVGRLAVSWYPPAQARERLQMIFPGARLLLDLRVRRATSLFNRGGFDHAGWYLAKGLAGRAYVRELNVTDEPAQSTLDRVRDRVRSWIEAEAPPEMAGPLVAMVLGDQSGIDDTQWAVFRATGTAHLVAISGLHVGIVAGLAAWVVGAFWRRVPWLALRWPTRDAAVLGGFVAALGYGAIAGFGIPVTRAVIMLGVAALAWLSRRAGSPMRILLLAMVAVLIFDPWAVLAIGFWLSFLAVAALVLVLSGRQGRSKRWVQFARAQWAISWLTLPVVLGAFGAPSLISPVANALAIPVVSLLLVPVLLLATVFGSTTLLLFAATVLDVLMQGLGAMATWTSSQGWATPPVWMVAIVVMAFAVSLLPRGTPGRWLSVACLIPLVLWRPPWPARGALEVTVIDVGQGLSVLVKTATHALLYDAGRSYFRGGDAGESVVLPALASAGVSALDTLVLSHDDSDHVGGAASIAGALMVEKIIGGVGVALDGRVVMPCVAGQQWQWDGVRFEWLYPQDGTPAPEDNDRSCVLRVAAGQDAVLLTGDITRRTEHDLVATHALGDVSVVIAPHHGSKSSSSETFINALDAAHVIFSAGYRNPYGHPAPEVVARWQAQGVRAWNTAEVGAVLIEIDDKGAQVHGLASEAKRYWHRQ